MTSAQMYAGMPGFSTSVRPMTDSERKAAVSTLRPLRNNARGMAMVSILMALMINFVSDPIAMMLPILFGLFSLGMAVQVRRGAGKISKMLETGTVTEARIVPKLRSAVSFARMNLMDGRYPVGAEMDIIFCRNVLIYFDRPTQEQVIARLAECLAPGGHLFLGHSETITGFDLPLVQVANTIFHRI